MAERLRPPARGLPTHFPADSPQEGDVIAWLVAASVVWIRTRRHIRDALPNAKIPASEAEPTTPQGVPSFAPGAFPARRCCPLLARPQPEPTGPCKHRRRSRGCRRCPGSDLSALQRPVIRIVGVGKQRAPCSDHSGGLHRCRPHRKPRRHERRHKGQFAVSGDEFSNCIERPRKLLVALRISQTRPTSASREGLPHTPSARR
jgi:hypothetical protein